MLLSLLSNQFDKGRSVLIECLQAQVLLNAAHFWLPGAFSQSPGQDIALLRSLEALSHTKELSHVLQRLALYGVELQA